MEEKEKLKYRRNVFVVASVISAVFLAFSFYAWNVARNALDSCAYPSCVQSPGVVPALTTTFLLAGFIMDVSTGLTIIVLGLALRFHLQARSVF